MATATAKKVTSKKVPAKKTAARKTAAKKAAPKTSKMNFKDSADKAVNVYLGVIGKGLDLVQEKIESTRKDNKKRVSQLETRGVKLRKNLTKRVKSIDIPDAESLKQDVKEQFNKVQDQVDDAVDTVKSNLKTAA